MTRFISLTAVWFLLLPSFLFAERERDSAQLDGVRLDQRIGDAIDLNVRFRDELGNEVELRRFFHGVPVILIPVYYRCPMLCNQVLNALVRTMKQVSFDGPNDFQVVIFSIDPREQAVLAGQKKLHYLEQYDRPGANEGWHFLTGDEPQIRALTEAIGFHYTYDPKTDQYAHPAAITILSPKGVINRYLLGLDFSARDMRLALVESGNGRLGSVVDRILLRCYSYDPAAGRYGLAIMTSVRIAGVLTVFALAGSIVYFARRYRQVPMAKDIQL